MKNLITIGAISLLLAVLLGAFGAHGFSEILEANARLGTWKTAVDYHFYHGIGILILAILSKLYDLPRARISAMLMLGGIFLFSGSLYILSLTNILWLGAITPLGGLCFIIAWLLLALDGLQTRLSKINKG